MFIPRKTDILALPILLGFVLVASSYQAKHHLRPEMPDGFFRPGQNSKNPALDQRIASAYWETVVMDVQWKYGYAYPLPADPPEEFRINAQALEPEASDQAIRMLYWHRLQQIWYTPEIWDERYSWDFGWLSGPAVSVSKWMEGEAGHLFPSH